MLLGKDTGDENKETFHLISFLYLFNFELCECITIPNITGVKNEDISPILQASKRCVDVCADRPRALKGERIFAMAGPVPKGPRRGWKQVIVHVSIPSKHFTRPGVSGRPG